MSVSNIGWVVGRVVLVAGGSEMSEERKEEREGTGRERESERERAVCVCMWV